MTTPYCLEGTANDALLTNLKELVGRSNQLTAQLLAHLAEVDARGIHRDAACSSLYTYCVYELRMSEDQAQRRVTASRAARRFPILFEMLESAAIHMTGIVLLAPHLTESNHQDLLARSRFRTKREIQLLVAEVAPRPEVPGRIFPLGPRRTSAPSMARYTASFAGPVREIPPGNHPGGAPTNAPESMHPSALARTTDDIGRLSFASPRDATDPAHTGDPANPANPSAPARSVSHRYEVRFTADQEHIDLLEEARDLLQHQVPNRDIAAVQKIAMRELVNRLRKLRRAETDRPHAPKDTRHDHQRKDRYVPAQVTRDVWRRDEARCTFVSKHDQRCRETAGLELDHATPVCRGGESTVENLRLRCRAHNQHAAERALGTQYMRNKRDQRSGDQRSGDQPTADQRTGDQGTGEPVHRVSDRWTNTRELDASLLTTSSADRNLRFTSEPSRLIQKSDLDFGTPNYATG